MPQGSYCGQDAYNDMFVTERNYGLLHGKRTAASATIENCRCAELYARSASNFDCGGGINIESTTRDSALCLLWKTYGEEKVLQWGSTIMERLQQTEILQQGMYEKRIPSETQNRIIMDDSTLPCTKFIAEWLLRDMWEQQECGCTPQGWESPEQYIEQSAKSMPELPYKNPSSCKEMFDMWGKSEGIWLLQQALYQIQEIRKSVNREWEGGDGMNDVSTAVRRLTPL